MKQGHQPIKATRSTFVWIGEGDLPHTSVRWWFEQTPKEPDAQCKMVYNHICQHPGQNPHQICHMLGISRDTLNHILIKMETCHLYVYLDGVEYYPVMEEVDSAR